MNKKENIIHVIANAVMGAGSNAVSVDADLHYKGKVVGVIVYPDGSHNNNANIISMALRDLNKGYVEEAVHVDNYKHPDNGYTGLRPVNDAFLAGRKIRVEFTALNNVVANTAFQVVFIIEQTQD